MMEYGCFLFGLLIGVVLGVCIWGPNEVSHHSIPEPLDSNGVHPEDWDDIY